MAGGLGQKGLEGDQRRVFPFPSPSEQGAHLRRRSKEAGGVMGGSTGPRNFSRPGRGQGVALQGPRLTFPPPQGKWDSKLASA